jgi:hypothetical protein
MKDHCRSLEPIGKFILALALACTLYSTQARADITNICANTSVQEGSPGDVTCTVTNDGVGTGSDPVEFLDEFAYAEWLSGDESDDIIAVGLFGPNPDFGNPVTFTIAIGTDAADGTDPHPDLGLNEVTLILLAVDECTGDFVPTFNSPAAVSVYDEGASADVPTDTYPVIPIFSPPDYYNTVYDAEDRGLVNSDIPEPAPLFLLGSGVLGLIRVGRRSCA